MKAQVTERNMQIVAAYTAGNTNKRELARYFGVSASTVRRVLAGVVMSAGAIASVQPAFAMKDSDLPAIQSYLDAHAGLPDYLKNEILTADDLAHANRILNNNHYWDGSKQVLADQIPTLATPTTVPTPTPSENNTPVSHQTEQPHLDAPSDADLFDARNDARKVVEIATLNAIKNAEKQEDERQAHAERIPAQTVHSQQDDLRNKFAQAKEYNAHAERFSLVIPETFAGRANAAHERVQTQLKYNAVADGQAQQSQAALTADKYAVAQRQQDDLRNKFAQAKESSTHAERFSLVIPETFAGRANAAHERVQTQSKYNAVADGQAQQAQAALTADKYAVTQRQQDDLRNRFAQAKESSAHAERFNVVTPETFTGLENAAHERVLTQSKYNAVADGQAALNNANKQDDERQAHAERMPAPNNAEATHLDGQHNVELNPAHANPEGQPVDTKAVAQRQLTADKYISASRQTVAQTTATPAQQTVVYQQIRSTYYDKQITALNAEAEQNHAEVLAESHSRAVGDAQTLSQANDYTNKKFSDLKSQVDDNKDQANAGTASALAATGIPQVETGSDFMVGAGAGTYGNQSAVAVGVSGHLTAKTVTKLAVSGDTNSGFGASAGIGWNF